MLIDPGSGPRTIDEAFHGQRSHETFRAQGTRVKVSE